MKKFLSAAMMVTVLTMSAPAYSETLLKYTPSAEPKTLDPVVTWLLVVQQHGYLIYDTLFSLDENMVPQPQMVGDYSISDDGKVYTMTLRDGLKFHDGSAVTAKDVIASVNRWAKRDTIGMRLVKMGMVLAAVDEKTFTVSMDAATDLLLQGFAKSTAAALFIMREQDALTDDTTPVENHIGSGPFRFVEAEYRPGAKATYEKFTDYRPRSEPPSYLSGGKVVNIDRLEWLIMPDATTAVSALMAGETDMYEAPPMDLLPLLDASGTIQTRPLGTLGQAAYMRFNFLHPPFNDARVRKAASLLVDQKQILSVIAGTDGKYWKECYSFLGCGGVNETEAGMEWARKRDVEQAKILLKESGYAGEPIVMPAPGDNEVLKAISSVLEAQLREGGFNVDVQYADFTSFFSRLSNRALPKDGGWNIFPMWSFTFELDNPIGNFYLNADCEDGFLGWQCSPEIEAAKAEFAAAPNPDAAKKLVEKIQLLSASEMPVVLLGKFFSPIAYKSDIKGFLDTPMPVFWNLSK